MRTMRAATGVHGGRSASALRDRERGVAVTAEIVADDARS
jgi:hypothetical protein